MSYTAQIITWYFGRFIFKVFLRLKIEGLENLNSSIKKGGVVFVANHGGKSDAFIIGCSLPLDYFKKIKKLRYMAHPKYSENIIYGPILRLLGAYSIRKCGGDYEKALENTIEILKSNQSLVIFPVGKIEPNLIAEHARPGVAYLAEKLNSVLVPVYVANSHKISIFEFFGRKRQVKVVFGQPFQCCDIASQTDNLRERARKITAKVAELATA